MFRWYVYTGDFKAGLPLQIIGYVENSCESNSSGLYPGALEVAQAVFGHQVEVVEGGHVTNPRRTPVQFDRLGESKRIFVRRGLLN